MQKVLMQLHDFARSFHLPINDLFANLAVLSMFIYSIKERDLVTLRRNNLPSTNITVALQYIYY